MKGLGIPKNDKNFIQLRSIRGKIQTATPGMNPEVAVYFMAAASESIFRQPTIKPWNHQTMEPSNHETMEQ